MNNIRQFTLICYQILLQLYSLQVENGQNNAGLVVEAG